MEWNEFQPFLSGRKYVQPFLVVVLILGLSCCRDGRIKVLGGDSIEAIFTSTKPLPFKNLEVSNYGLEKKIVYPLPMPTALSIFFNRMNVVVLLYHSRLAWFTKL